MFVCTFSWTLHMQLCSLQLNMEFPTRAHLALQHHINHQIRFILWVLQRTLILKLSCGIIQIVIGLKLYNRGPLILLQIP